MSTLAILVACLEALFALGLLVALLAFIDDCLHSEEFAPDELEPAEWLQHDLIAQTLQSTRGTEISD